MLDRIARTATAVGVTATRAAPDAARGRAVAPPSGAPALHDEEPNPDWNGNEAAADRARGGGAGAALRGVLAEALAVRRDTAEAEEEAASSPLGASPHGRAARAYGQQADLQRRGAVLRPGAVFSSRF